MRSSHDDYRGSGLNEIRTPRSKQDFSTYLSLFQLTPREGVEHGRGGRPGEVGNRKSVRFRLQFELLHAQLQSSILVLELLVPELILLHPRELVLQQFYVLHRGFEDRTFVRPDVPDNFVIPVTEVRKTPTLYLRCTLTAVIFRQTFLTKSINAIFNFTYYTRNNIEILFFAIVNFFTSSLSAMIKSWWYNYMILYDHVFSRLS